MIVPAFVQYAADRGEARGRPAGIEAEEFFLLFGPDDGKGVAADAVRGGFRDGQRRRRGHGRIHRVPAFLQDLQPGGRRLGTGRVHHAAAGVDREPLRRVLLTQRIKLVLHDGSFLEM